MEAKRGKSALIRSRKQRKGDRQRNRNEPLDPVLLPRTWEGKDGPLNSTAAWRQGLVADYRPAAPRRGPEGDMKKSERRTLGKRRGNL